MADVLTPEQRRKNMQHIRSNDTKIEVLLRKALWEKGYRYRKNYKDLPGKPDIVLTKYKIAIFCDGEFFHGKDWEVLKPRLEKSNNSEFWISKISRNRERDDKYDGSLVMGNLMNAATSLGLGSIWIHRAKEEFESEFGKKILADLGIEGNYEGIGHCAIGYAAAPANAPASRKDNYVYYVR